MRRIYIIIFLLIFSNSLFAEINLSNLTIINDKDEKIIFRVEVVESEELQKKGLMYMKKSFTVIYKNLLINIHYYKKDLFKVLF